MLSFQTEFELFYNGYPIPGLRGESSAIMIKYFQRLDYPWAVLMEYTLETFL